MASGFRPWFERYPKRFEGEVKILRDLGFTLNQSALQNERAVMFAGTVPADPSRVLRIYFPEAFPSLPPRVFDTLESPLLRRHHEPNTRELCLFGPASHRWNAYCNSFHVLNEVNLLLETFTTNEAAVARDEVPEPISPVLNYQYESIMVPPSISSLDQRVFDSAKGTFTLRYASPQKDRIGGQGVVISVNIGKIQAKADTHYETFLQRSTQVIVGDLIWLPTQPTKVSLEELLSLRTKQHGFGKKTPFVWVAVVFPEQSGTQNDKRLSWVFAKLFKDGRTHFIRGFPYRSEERNARIPAVAGLDDRKIVLVGCGCLGSKIAVHLAASGARNFTFVDCDFIEPYNAVRHEVGVKFFGVNKAHALAQRVYEINPEAHDGMKDFIFRIGAPNSVALESQMYEVLSSADIVIDATGSHGASRWLNDMCFDLGVPTIYASVTNGAWGGEVVRVIPHKTACWLCWNNQYADSSPPGEPSEGFFAPGCNQPSFTGTSYDASIIASFASALIVDTLLKDSAKQVPFAGDYIRWTGREASGTPVLRAEIHSILQRPGCQLCGSMKDAS